MCVIINHVQPEYDWALVWSRGWEEFARELEARTTWGPEHVRPTLRTIWSQGRSLGWARRVLLPAMDAAEAFERTMASVRRTVSIRPGEVVELAEAIERLCRPRHPAP